MCRASTPFFNGVKGDRWPDCRARPGEERVNRIGRGGCAFFRKSFVLRSIRISTMGHQSARSSLLPRLAKDPQRHPFPPN
jgi:hypothetical protein